MLIINTQIHKSNTERTQTQSTKSSFLKNRCRSHHSFGVYPCTHCVSMCVCVGVCGGKSTLPVWSGLQAWPLQGRTGPRATSHADSQMISGNTPEPPLEVSKPRHLHLWVTGSKTWTRTSPTVRAWHPPETSKHLQTTSAGDGRRSHPKLDPKFRFSPSLPATGLLQKTYLTWKLLLAELTKLLNYFWSTHTHSRVTIMHTYPE